MLTTLLLAFSRISRTAFSSNEDTSTNYLLPFSETAKQNPHSSILIFGSDFWHSEHIRLVLLMAMHAWQKSWSSSTLCRVPSNSIIIMPSMKGRISSMPSIFIARPRTFLEYLLTADWETPRISAIWSWLKPCSSSSFATNALMAGRTDFTATSHGSIKRNSLIDLFRWEKYLNMTYVILFMTYVMTASKRLKLSFFRVILTLSPTLSWHTLEGPE